MNVLGSIIIYQALRIVLHAGLDDNDWKYKHIYSPSEVPAERLERVLDSCSLTTGSCKRHWRERKSERLWQLLTWSVGHSGTGETRTVKETTSSQE